MLLSDTKGLIGCAHGSTLTPVNQVHSKVDTDPDTAATVHLLHRRRGWLWTLTIGVVAWLVAVGLLGTLDPNASGAGEAFGAILVILLTAIVVIALIAAIVDSVKLRGRDPGVRSRASSLTSHHPVRSHAYRYPPKHRGSWVFGWILMLILLGLGVAAFPGLVNGIAYLAGAENSVTFMPVSSGQQCGRYGCSPITNGFLETPGDPSVTWSGSVPLGVPFQVRQPLMDWGFGSELIGGDGGAIGSIFAGALFDGFSVLVLFAAYRLIRNWRRHRQMAVVTGPAG